jgi:hypothetical protein
MAGEWLKLELATPDKPEIIKAARILGIDKDAVLGKLVRVWAWFDRNSVDGVVDGIVEADIDALAFQSGFAAALKQVHWMDFDNEKQWVSLVNFDRHNGDTAKQRALKNQRQAKWRAGKVDAEVSTETSTREEKRRNISTPEILPVPDFVPEALWNDFLAIRKGLKAKNTVPAIKALITELKKLQEQGHSPVDVINQSIRSSWKDVYPIKGDKPKQENATPRKYL